MESVVNAFEVCPRTNEGGIAIREIKFRGRRVDNGEWVHGYFIMNSMSIGDTKPYIFDGQYEHQVELETVGQFVGLRDKNGAGIYEGDACKVTNPYGDVDKPCIVQWDDGASCYPYEPEDGYGDYDVSSIGWAMGIGYRFEVIGNIYEHPELIQA